MAMETLPSPPAVPDAAVDVDAMSVNTFSFCPSEREGFAARSTQMLTSLHREDKPPQTTNGITCIAYAKPRIAKSKCCCGHKKSNDICTKYVASIKKEHGEEHEEVKAWKYCLESETRHAAIILDYVIKCP